jgi:hypothetical protein
MNAAIWDALPIGTQLQCLCLAVDKAGTQEARQQAEREYRATFKRAEVGRKHIENLRRMLDDKPMLPVVEAGVDA